MARKFFRMTSLLALILCLAMSQVVLAQSTTATIRGRVVDEGGNPVDPLGTWVNGAEVAGFAGLRTMLLEERDQFARTLTGKLLAYALGRKVEYYDQPAVRQIVRDAAAQDYRWSSIITGIVESPAFLMRAPQ